MIREYILKALAVFWGAYLIYFLIAFIIKLFRKNQCNYKKILIDDLLYAYIVMMLSQTILPYWQMYFDPFEIVFLGGSDKSLNFIPFKTIMSYLFDSNPVVDEFNGLVAMVNILGNILMFMPIGFLLGWAKRVCYQKMLIISCILSLFIEVIQYFIGRSSDIDDILLNVLGACVGYFAYKIAKYIYLKSIKTTENCH